MLVTSRFMAEEMAKRLAILLRENFPVTKFEVVKGQGSIATVNCLVGERHISEKIAEYTNSYLLGRSHGRTGDRFRSSSPAYLQGVEDGVLLHHPGAKRVA